METMRIKALVLHGKEDLRFEELDYDFGKIPQNSVVIKVLAAGLGPYDLGFITGRLSLNDNCGPINIGSEGSGIVIKSDDLNLLNKRVAFLTTSFEKPYLRAFSEYVVVDKNYVMILPDIIDDNQAAYLMANPVTAHILFNSIIKKHKSIVQDTSSSSLARMITKLCRKNGIKIINIVRKDEYVNEFDLTFNSNSTNFWDNLSKAIKDEPSPSLYITYQGGNFPSRIFDRLPNNSTMCGCGNINSELLSGYSSTDFIFKGKTIIGFQVINYLAEMTEEEKQAVYQNIIEDFSVAYSNNVNSDGNPLENSIYFTRISKEFSMQQFDEARKFYDSNMSKGKIILKP